MVAERFSMEAPLGSIFVGAVLNTMIGATVLMTPLVARATGVAFWIDVVTGTLVVALAGFNAWMTARRRMAPPPAASVSNMALGSWLIVFPFLIEASAPFVWTNVLLGVLLVLVAGYNAWGAKQARDRRLAGERTQA